MVSAVRVFYSSNNTCQFVRTSEFLKTCGIYVYEAGEGCEKQAESPGESIEWSLVLDCGHEQLEERRVSLIEEIDRENKCGGFLLPFFHYFQEQALYRALFCVHNISTKDSALLQDAKEQLQKGLRWLEEKNVFSAASCFSRAYLGYCLYKAEECVQENFPDEEGKGDRFRELKRLCDQARELDSEYPGIDELEGDMYFTFQNHYIFGIMHYENCLNTYNYTAPYKLSKYWRDIVESKRNERSCLKKSYDCNRNYHEAAFDLAYYYEGEGRVEEAVAIYRSIVNKLKKKAEDRELTLSEFSSLCKAHKRIGCMMYKDEYEPRYYEAIEEYKKIFQLWNECGKNRFICCFPKEHREELVEHYRNSFSIEGVLFSLAKIYRIISEEGRVSLAEIFGTCPVVSYLRQEASLIPTGMEIRLDKSETLINLGEEMV